MSLDFRLHNKKILLDYSERFVRISIIGATHGYTLYLDFLYAIHKRNQTYFDALLTQNISHLPATYQTTIRTFKKYQKQIYHALNYSYSNEQLECLNNHISVLKRNAYSFRNFYNFKLRIFVQQGQAIQTK